MAKNFDALSNNIQAHLYAGEKIEAAVTGMYLSKIFGNKAARKGTLIATSQRLVFYAKGITGYELDSHPYAEINNLETQRTVGTWQLRFTTARSTYHLRYAKGEVEAFAQLVRSRIGHQAVPAAQAPSAADELTKLAGLLGQGLITREQYDAQAARLLG